MRRRSRLLATLLVLVFMAGSAAAQTTGAVSGSISDQTGAPLSGVRITIRGAVNRAADSDAAGDFAFPAVPAGNYEITAELRGFEAAHREVYVAPAERVTTRFTLQVAIAEETIVTASKTGERDVRTISHSCAP